MTCVVSGMIAASLFAVPAYRGWRTVNMSDGSEVTIHQVGDEFFHYWEDENGTQYVEEAEGWQVASQPAVQSAVSKAKQASRRYNRTRPNRAIGAFNMAPRGLVILVNYKDIKYSDQNPRKDMDSLMNAASYTYSGAIGSTREYFRAQSNGQYVPDFDVVGPYTLDYNRSHYGSNDKNGDDLLPGDMVIEACKAADADGVDFTKYNNDGDKEVDFVYIIYAGGGEADGGPKESIWPHNWEIDDARSYDNCSYPKDSCKVDGLYINNYACSGELRSNVTDSRCAIGTIAHEFGHVLGLPDYYVTSESATNYKYNYTPGAWTIMDYGSYNNDGNTPPNYSVFDKYYFGWVTPEVLAKDAQENVTVTTDYASSYQINGGTTLLPYNREQYIWYVENRQKTGWDAYLPGHGMLIWEVKYNASNWEADAPNNEAVGYTIVTANSPTRPYSPYVQNTTLSSTSKTPFPGTNRVDSVSLASGCVLSGITESNGVIDFKYNGGIQKLTCSYELVGENCTVPADGELATNSALSLIIKPNTGYILTDPSCWTVEMGNHNELVYGVGFTYNATTGEFRIEKVTNDVTILVEGKQSFAIQWKSNGTLFAETQSAGTVILPENEPSPCEGMVFTGWCKTLDYSSASEAPEYVKTGDAAQQGDIFYAVFAQSSGEEEPVEDVLTNANTIKSSSSTYESWTATATSPAVYSGQSAGSYSSIQLRSNNTNSGIVTTTSGGTISKVTVVWNSNTNADRTLDIYGKHTAYSAPTDLYGNAGTLLGSLNNGDGELAISDEYEYIGIRSRSGALYLDEITITWGKGATYSNYTTACGTEPIEPKTYTIGFYNNGVLIGQAQTVTEGQAAVPPTNVVACEGYTFAGWSKTELAADNTIQPAYVTSFKATKDQNYYAVFTKTDEQDTPAPSGETVSDKLTRSTTGVTGTSYTEWTNKKLNSSAVYAGMSAGGNDAIQLRSDKSNAGIVTTTSGGKISKIAVEWESHTADKRRIDVYGKKSAFSKPSEMYNSQTRGDLLGSIINGTNTELEITGDYAYVGIRSYNGAMYLSSVTFTWGTNGGGSSSTTVTYYTTSPDCGATPPVIVPDTFTIGFYNDGELIGEQNVVEGQAAVVPANVEACEGYTFAGWSTVELAADNTVKPDYVTSFVATKDQNYYAVFTKREATSGTGSTAVEDVLNNANTINNETTVYSSWTASATSPAEYAGQSAGSSNTIQLRSNNSNSGIVTTTSGGKISKVTVTWNESTTSSRILDVYGKNSAYTDPTDLYNTDNQGTKVGSIAYGTSELAIEGEYTYIGVRSNSGALYLDEIIFTWGEGSGSVTYYTTSPDCTTPPVIVPDTFTIAFYNDGELIGEQNVVEGQAAVAPSNVETCEGYTFAGWSTVELETGNTEKPDYVTSFIATRNQNYYAVFTKSEEDLSGAGNTYVEDVLNNANTINKDTTSYSEWSDKSYNSAAVYAGMSAGSSNTIQLRSNNSNSGIVTTASGGKIAKVTVAWNEATDTARILDVYGRDGAYAAATDLYNADKQGTKVGSIKYGTSELVIDGEYEFIGVRSNKSALYMDSIIFTWTTSGSGTVTYYTTAPDCTPQEECELAGIVLQTEDVQKVFKEGSTFSYGGLVVMAEYENCPSKNITAAVEVIAPDMSTPGTKTVKVIYHTDEEDLWETYEITVVALEVYTVRFLDNGAVISTQEVKEGQKAALPEEPEGGEGYSFVGWWTESLAPDNKEAHAWVSDFTVTGDQDYYAIYAHVASGSSTPVENELVRETTGVAKGAGYSDWTATIGEASYAGRSAGNNDAIQLNTSSSAKAGIVTTVSGGKAMKVEVEWEEHTTEGNTLDIYGKDKAYEAPADLYENSKQGTLIGSIECEKTASSASKKAKAAEYTIEGSYAYIGVRSKSGALYIKKLTITWSQETVTYTSSIVDDPTGMESVQTSDSGIRKILRDGQLYILHDGRMYNVQGQLVIGNW